MNNRFNGFSIERNFLILLLTFACSYFVIETLLIPHLLLVFDEFWFAQHIFQYTYQIPYRDFLPYKTTLGYYLLTLPFFFSHQLLTPIFLMKIEIAVVNTLAMCGIGYFSIRFFSKQAILATLVLIVMNQLFLLYSVDLRVDMLTTWLGLISILCILYRKENTAGLFLGLSFLCSQKALWFVMAINGAFLLTFFMTPQKKQTFRSWIGVNMIMVVMVAVYFLIGSIIANSSILWKSMFYEAYTQAKIYWYSQVYIYYWKFILANGCLLLTLLPLTWLTLLFSPLTWERIFIMTFSVVMTLFIVSYQQPFPYNMIFFVPVFFLVYADFFSQCELITSHKTRININSRFLFWFISIYIILLLGLFICLEVVLPYYLVLVIPILWGLYLYKPKPLLPPLLLICLFFTGIFYPLIRTIEFSLASNNSYQKYNLTLLNELVKDEGDYVAGTPMLYYKKQPIVGLENLISPAIAYLYHPSSKLLPILIPSLYLFPVTQAQVIEQLKNKPVKIYINNVRIHNLPPALSNYLRDEFSHFWGSLYIYAPHIKKEQAVFFLKFDGRYKLLASSNTDLLIDNKKVIAQSMIELKKGFHRSYTRESYQLKLIPDVALTSLNPNYKEDNWLDSVK